ILSSPGTLAFPSTPHPLHVPVYTPPPLSFSLTHTPSQKTWRPCPSPVQSISFPAFPSSLRRVAPGHLRLTCLLHLPPLLLVATSLRCRSMILSLRMHQPIPAQL
ncbi:hypothetical protein CCUS01_17327, partial [Colletotrichum cuscutae]